MQREISILAKRPGSKTTKEIIVVELLDLNMFEHKMYMIDIRVSWVNPNKKIKFDNVISRMYRDIVFRNDDASIDGYDYRLKSYKDLLFDFITDHGITVEAIKNKYYNHQVKPKIKLLVQFYIKSDIGYPVRFRK